MALTRPRGEQLRLESERTGSHVLDDYLEEAELGDRTLADLLSDLFDTDGDFRADIFDFRIKPTTNELQFRIGDWPDDTSGWRDTGDHLFRQRGLHTSGTAYKRFDMALYGGSLFICTADHTSSTASPSSDFSIIIDDALLDAAVTAAQASATAAAASATNAATSETNAATSATNAAASASAAATSETNAAASASAASGSASASSTSATASAASASAASTSATNAAASATSASASASAAAASATDADDSADDAAAALAAILAKIPGSSTDNRLARFDGTTGNLQGSAVTLDDAGAMSGLTSISGTGSATFSGSISGNAVYAQHTGGAAVVVAKRGDLVGSPNWSGVFQWQAPNNSGNPFAYGNLVGRVSNGTVGAEAGHWLLTQYNGGVNTSIFDTVNAQFNLAVPLNTVGGLAAPATLRTQLGMSANGQSLVTAANYAAMRTLLLNEGKIRQVVFGSSGSSNSTNGAPYAPVLGQPATLYMTASDSSCLVIYNFQYTVSNGTGTPTGYTVPSYLNSSGVWTSMGFATTHTMSVGATAPGGTLAGRSSYIWTMAPGQRYTNLWQCRLQGGTASTATTLTIGVCEWVMIEYGGS